MRRRRGRQGRARPAPSRTHAAARPRPALAQWPAGARVRAVRDEKLPRPLPCGRPPRYVECAMPDLVIRDALLCDGSGREAVRGDLAVAGGRITALGHVHERGAAEIDAGGLALAPGFIDVHTHYDCQLFWDPSASPSSWHGVTTVVTGNCGFTIAPCRPADRETLLRLLQFVEGMPIATLRAGIAWGWEDFAGYLDALERLPLGVNVAPLVGHSALRLGVLGAAALERAATGEERAALAAAVRAAVAAGAIGWSTSRSPTHFFGDDGRPAPSRLADDEELLALAAALRDLDRGVIEVAPRTTIAGFDEKAEEQRFFAALARASGKVVSWAPLLDNPFAPGSAQRLLAEAAALQAAGGAGAALRRPRVSRGAQAVRGRVRRGARARLGSAVRAPARHGGRAPLSGSQRRRDRRRARRAAPRRLLRSRARRGPRHPVGRRDPQRGRGGRGRAAARSRRAPRALGCGGARRHALRSGLHHVPARALGAGAGDARARGGRPPPHGRAGASLRAHRPRAACAGRGRGPRPLRPDAGGRAARRDGP